MYQLQNFTLNLKVRGGDDGSEPHEHDEEGCANRLKSPHRIQGLSENIYL